MTEDVNDFFQNGCGRCSQYATSRCKVKKWQQELIHLRKILSQTSLKEDCKWGSPCYTHQEKNIVSLSALKNHCVLGFFKGSLIKNHHGLLQRQGNNSNAGRIIKFTSVHSIIEQKENIIDIINQAIKIEDSNKKVAPLVLATPEILAAYFDQDQAYHQAFEQLSPGRKKALIIHITQAKQESTQLKRIQNNRERVMQGKSVHDCVCGKSKRYPRCDGSHKEIH